MAPKKNTPSKEISDASNNKILELEGELERQKTAKDQETAELRELAEQKTELARQQKAENQRLAAQLAELQRRMNNSGMSLVTSQVPSPLISRVPTNSTTTSTPPGIWGVPDTMNRRSAAARSLEPDLQEEDFQNPEEKEPMSAASALAALEEFGGNLFGGNDGHIPPSLTSEHSAFLKHLSAAPDGPLEPVTLAQHMITAISLFFGTELNSNDFEKFSCEQISVALVAQKLTLLHAMYGVVGQGKDEDKSQGITEGDAIWMGPILSAQRKGGGGRKGLGLSNELCMGLDRPTPTKQPAAYKVVAQVNGFLQALISRARERDASITANLPTTPVIGVYSAAVDQIKAYVTAHRPAIITLDYLYSLIGRLFDNIAMSRDYVSTGVLDELFQRTNAIGIDINTYKEQNNSVLKTPTAPDILKNVQLRVSTATIVRNLDYNAMNMEQELSADGMLQYTYRETHRKIVQFVEKILTEYDTDGLITIPTLLKLFPRLLNYAETVEASTFADYKATFPNSKATSYGNLILGRVHKGKTGKHAPGNAGDPPSQEGGAGGGGRGGGGGRAGGGRGGGGGRVGHDPAGGGRGGGGGRVGHDPGRGQVEPPKKSNRYHQVKINFNGTTPKSWKAVKDEFAWLGGLQHVSIPASKDHIYLTFDNREHAIAARDQLTGATWDGLKMTVHLVEPEARANRAGSGFVLSSTASSTASDDDDARSTASGYSDAVSVAAARRASAPDADQGAGTTPVIKFTGSSLENLRESLNLSNDTKDAVSILPDGQLRLEFANPDGEEGPDDPP